MRTIKFLLQKEFLQIFRNKGMLPIIFVMPVIQLLVLSFAATYELNQVDFALVDRDQSQYSRELIQKLQVSGYFHLSAELTNAEAAQELLDAGKVKVVVQIPHGFQEDLSSGKPTDLQLIIDSVDGKLS